MDKNCNSCKKSFFEACETLKNNKEYQKIIKDDPVYIKEIDFKESFCCENYQSRYIEYPINVKKSIMKIIY